MIMVPKIGDSPSGKAVGSGPTIRGFESLIPSHISNIALAMFFVDRFMNYKCGLYRWGHEVDWRDDLSHDAEITYFLILIYGS